MLHNYSREKIHQILYYLQKNLVCEDNTNYTKLLKLVFFADRYHLRNYGTLMTNDDYYAMKMGPVGSKLYDLLKKRNNLQLNKIFTKASKKKARNIDEFDITIKKANDNDLSESNKIALNFAIKYFGKFNYSELSNITHDYPEWKRYESIFIDNERKRIEIIFEDFFNNPSSDAKYIKYYLKGNDPFYENPEISESHNLLE